MKLIIDISEEAYEIIKKDTESEMYIIQVIKQGTPLDDLRAEIENDWQLKKYPSSPFSCGLRRAIEIIDKYKAESEDKK